MSFGPWELRHCVDMKGESELGGISYEEETGIILSDSLQIAQA